MIGQFQPVISICYGFTINGMKMDGKWKSAEKKEKTMIPPRRGQVKERIFEDLGEKILNMTLGGGNVKKKQVASSSEDSIYVSSNKK
nr:hypothetical protein [Tanacetum cinerariifolium]